MTDLVIPFEELAGADLIVDATYEGEAGSQLSGEALNATIPGIGNLGGFRFAGRGEDKRVVILFTTGEDDDWPDEIDPSTGRLIYFGDNKIPGQALLQTTKGGNKILERVFDLAHQGRDGRERIPPFFVFEKSPTAVSTRSFRFKGLAVPGAPDLDDSKDLVVVPGSNDGETFENYRAVFTILDEPVIPRKWVQDVLSANPFTGDAPDHWIEWIESGSYAPLISDGETGAPDMSPSSLTLRLEGSVDISRLRHAIGAVEVDMAAGTAITVDFAEGTFLQTAAVAQLTSWLLEKKLDGSEISLEGDQNIVNYLARMDVHRALGVEEPRMQRHPEGGRFIPLILVEDGNAVFDAVNRIADMVLQQFDGVAEFMPAFEWAVNEIVDNVFIHSKSKSPGVVCAQLFPNKRRLDIAICDSGIGIRGSLSEGFQLADDKVAIEKALQRGVTRNTDVGQGNGMAGTLEIMKRNDGSFGVWSGGALFRLEGGEDRGYETGTSITGTGVYLSFDLKHPVRLVDTWIASSGFSFIEMEAERIEEEGIRIMDACSHTGSRPPATRLRRKILALLPNMDGSLKLDFEGVKVLTSSFLDELLGRLNAELGNAVFNRRIIVSGLSEVHRNMANNVIGQRMDLEKPTDGSDEIAWVIEVEDDHSGRYALTISADVHSASVPQERHWCLVIANGVLTAIGRVYRTHRDLDAATVYFDRHHTLSDGPQTEELGFFAPGMNEVAPLKWDVFESAVETQVQGGYRSVETLKDQVHVRTLLELAARDDLLGPANGPLEEIIDMSARERYLVGKLSPKMTTRRVGLQIEEGASGEDVGEEGEENTEFTHEAGEEFPRASGKVVPDDDATDDLDTSENQSLVPSSLGLTFVVDPKVSSVTVNATWGKYERVANEDHDHVKKVKKRGTDEEHEIKIRVWQRVPRGGEVEIPLSDGPFKSATPDGEEPDVSIKGTCRTNAAGERLVTIFLVNGQTEPGENKDEAWIFQPLIEVRGGAGFKDEPIFLRRSAGNSVVEDPEKDKLALIYRNRLEFAVGHGISVHAEPSESDPLRAAVVRTEVVPAHEVMATETPGLDPEDRPAMRELVEKGWLDMKNLASMALDDLSDALEHLVDDYERWIGEQEARIGTDVTGHDDAAKDVVIKCRETLVRLREGIGVLKTDGDALRAFRFANEAMALQRIRSIYALLRRRGDQDVSLDSLDVPKNRSWRAFQLAFLLLSIPSMTDPRHPDRTEPLQANADLLWFPTGGGKTEAYLGVAAFAMAMRRLKPDLGGYDGREGLCVIMRYTLRLLTLQQFQRGATLMCAMEMLRRDDKDTWGETPFTLGLWVGNRVTPGTTEEAGQAIQAILNEQTPRRGSPHQLTSCPWCGEKIKARANSFKVDSKTKRTSLFCGDPFRECDFCWDKSIDEAHPGLPVTVVDEEIYHRPPTMMIATVDKFAMMSWRQEARTLFGRAEQRCERHGLLWPGHECGTGHQRNGNLATAKVIPLARPIRPPDLIIQDEFHLISGPLGTMVGLYETAIDELSVWDLDGKSVRPKVVASTATVRKAEEQVRNVFMRRVSVFPPSGLDVEDNFFSVQRPIEKAYGRRYLGICAPGASRPAVLIRTYAAFLTASQALFEAFGEVADPYMSLVGYFNSLRELGGMRRLAEDDVRTRCFRVKMSMIERPGLAQRSLRDQVVELTSRVPSQRIPEYLDEMELQFEQKFDGEQDKYRTKWGENKRPIDVVLATNMLSVGVDVNRLGLMVVNGQPKGTAEYIQATSRVGRAHPGLVATVLTWARPRDLSHYETFEHYHATFYQHVEAQSATPFSPRALDRGLTGMAVALMRAQSVDLAPNQGAGTMTSPSHPSVDDATKLVTERAWTVTQDPNRRDLAEEAMKLRGDDWADEAQVPGRQLVYSEWRAGAQSVALMKQPGTGAWTKWTAPTSMREVEPGVSLLLDERRSKFQPQWKARKSVEGESDA